MEVKNKKKIRIMSRKLKLYNLNFFDAKLFVTFTIDGYAFHPILSKQPKRKTVYSSDDALKANRAMSLNSYVLIPKKQNDSIFYKGGKYSDRRKRKFLDDLSNIISILIGKNVVPKFYKKFNMFPLCSKKQCEMISKNSSELQHHLETALTQIKNKKWKNKYDNGFHIVMFYNATNVFIEEHRFLAFMSIWEYLYYCDHRNKPYNAIDSASLNAKIYYLVKEYLVHKKHKMRQEKLRIFSDLRNQLSHSGKLPIQSPKSPFQYLSYIGCSLYVKLFQRLTQVLVLKTLGIESIDELNVFNVRDHFEELLDKGSVTYFEDADKRGVKPFFS